MLFEYALLQSTAVVSFMMSMMQGYKMLLLLGGFMLITNYAESTALRTTDKNLQYMAYAGYVFAEALFFVPLVYMAAIYTQGFEIFQQAGIVTLTLFAGLSAVVILTKKRLLFF